MGFKLNGRHTDEFKIAATLKTAPYIPPKRQVTVDINGRDGQQVFEDCYDNAKVEFACSIVSYDKLERRKRAREISTWLSSLGPLILDQEPDVIYNVIKSVCDLSASVTSREYRDDFTVTFECEPYQSQTYYNNDLTWEKADSAWPYTNIPWNGYERIFSVISGQTIDINNAGSYKSLPVIVLNGVAGNVTIGSFTFKNLSGIIYIDCKSQVVYSIVNGNKVNKISDFEGDFLELKPGSNQFTITGSITNLTITFDYKNTYL